MLTVSFPDMACLAEPNKTGPFQSERKDFHPLAETQSYFEQNDIKINVTKTKIIVFNQT